MRRCFLAVSLAVGLGGAALLAADFWQSKKYSEWSEKEVRKMLNNSPWAQPVSIRMDALGGGSMGGRGRRGGGSGVPSATSGPGGGGGGFENDTGGGAGARGEGGFGTETVPTVTVTVRWHSALPLKQAVARARFGDEVSNSPEAAKMLARQEERHILGIAGLPMQAVRGNPESWKSGAMLKIKGKEPLAPEQVRGEKAQDLANLYFVFPKQQNGAPFIGTADKEVEVVVKLGQLEIKRKFRLKDMVYEGKLEI